MCGIAGFIVKKETPSLVLEKLLDELLGRIAIRGGDATGFVARSSDGRCEWEKAACDVEPFLRERHALPAGTVACLAHTRFATQGSAGFARNNHPLRRGSFYLIHNGVITNDAALYRLAGREPYGAVDSEALVACIAASDSLEASLPLLEQARGTAAIAAMDERSGEVMLARLSSSPLYVLETRRLVLWASTALAVELAHKLAVGSLGKRRAVALVEGEARIYSEGRERTVMFAPLPWETSNYASHAATQGGSTQETLAASLAAKWADEGENLPVDDGTLARPYRSWIERCELCDESLYDSYDLWDESDYYEVCEDCYRTYSESKRSLPRSERGRV